MIMKECVWHDAELCELLRTLRLSTKELKPAALSARGPRNEQKNAGPTVARRSRNAKKDPA
jgi:hypothetical protein